MRKAIDTAALVVVAAAIGVSWLADEAVQAARRAWRRRSLVNVELPEID